MTRIIRAVVIALPLVWSVALLLHRVTQIPASLSGFKDTVTPLAERLEADPMMGDFHRFVRQVRPCIPPRARVILLGPARPEWSGDRKEFYKQFLFRMLPRPVRAVRTQAEVPERLAWTDYVVVYRTPLPAPEIMGFSCILDLGDRGQVHVRKERTP
jgi:hypothetical protein